MAPPRLRKPVGKADHATSSEREGDDFLVSKAFKVSESDKETTSSSTGSERMSKLWDVNDPLLECCTLLKRKFADAEGSVAMDFDVFTTHLLGKSAQQHQYVSGSDTPTEHHLRGIIGGFLQWHRSFLESLTDLTDDLMDKLPSNARDRSHSSKDECRLALCGEFDGQVGRRYFAVRHLSCCGVPTVLSCGSDRYLLVDSGSAVYESVETKSASDTPARNSSSGLVTPNAVLLLYRTLWNRMFRTVACGSNHSIAVTTAGEVFTWGDGCEYGQLGHGKGTESCEPRLVIDVLDDPVLHVACGAKHSAAVGVSGKLFTWGLGKRGRLGHGDEKDQWAPKHIRSARSEYSWKLGRLFQHATVAKSQSEQVVDVDVTKRSSSAVRRNVHNLQDSSPTTLKISNNFTFVDCGEDFTVAITATGRVVCFGENKNCQCGGNILTTRTTKKKTTTELPVESLRFCARPVLVARFSKTREESIAPSSEFLSARTASCGYMHTISISKDSRNLLSWGSGPGLGLGKAKQISDVASFIDTNHLLSGEVFVSIACGEFHSVAVTSAKRIFAWGNNIPGCLGLESSAQDIRMLWIPRVLTSRQIFGTPVSSQILVGCGLKYTVAIDSTCADSSLAIDQMSELSVSKAFARDTDVRKLMRSEIDRDMSWRLSKWLTELEDLATGRRAKLSKALRAEWRKGVPCGFRKRAWPCVIGNAAKVTEKDFETRIRQADRRLSRVQKSSHHHNTTSSTSSASHDWSAESMRLVDRDLKRTLAEHGLKFLFSSGGPLRADLRKVLLAFSHLRQEVAYVQGMSFVAAFMLINCSPETFLAFKCFTNVAMYTHLYSFYSFQKPHGKIAVRRYYDAFEALLMANAPRMFNHLRALGLVESSSARDRTRRVTVGFSFQSYAPSRHTSGGNRATGGGRRQGILCHAVFFPWLQTVFLKNTCLRLSLVGRIWDRWLLRREDGSTFLLTVAVAILKLFEKDLLKTSEIDEVLPLLQGKSSTANRKLWLERVQEKSLFRVISQLEIPAKVPCGIQELEKSDFGVLS
eukprot:g2262.t1